jgi:lycopene beta-cyclase
MQTQQYDYIVAGAGAAGLSLIMYFLKDDFFKDKKILLVDANFAKTNDKTWCFWEKERGIFENCVCKYWSHLSVCNASKSSQSLIEPYKYKMIKSIDFYQFCMQAIQANSNITLLEANLEKIQPSTIYTSKGIFKGNYIFNSAIFEFQVKPDSYHLIQHFKGWYLRFEKAVLNPDSALLMDFSVQQNNDCRFMYVLPTNSHEALVEYTVFSEKILDAAAYDIALQQYIQQKYPEIKFQIIHQEFGAIPMSNAPILSPHNGVDVISFGTAGYATKASTGYTFKYIQKQCESIVQHLKSKKSGKLNLMPNFKYRLYDYTLLSILSKREQGGAAIFYRLFSELPFQTVLKFLNEESSLLDDLVIMWHTHKPLFAKAAIREFWKLVKN